MSENNNIDIIKSAVAGTAIAVGGTAILLSLISFGTAGALIGLACATQIHKLAEKLPDPMAGMKGMAAGAFLSIATVSLFAAHVIGEHQNSFIAQSAPDLAP